MGRKSDYLSRLAETRALREGMMQNYTNWRDSDVQKGMTTQLYGMMMDPSKRGMGETELNQTRAATAEAISGARKSGMEDINRRVAASGMGSTGLGLRAALEANRGYARQQAESMRDINLANEQMKRDELWRSMAMSMEQQQQLANEMNAAYGLYGNMIGLDYTGIAGKNQPGFWRTLANSFAQSLGGTLGGGG